jgi:hypothetical protein
VAFGTAGQLEQEAADRPRSKGTVLIEPAADHPMAALHSQVVASCPSFHWGVVPRQALWHALEEERFVRQTYPTGQLLLAAVCCCWIQVSTKRDH